MKRILGIILKVMGIIWFIPVVYFPIFYVIARLGGESASFPTAEVVSSFIGGIVFYLVGDFLSKPKEWKKSIENYKKDFAGREDISWKEAWKMSGKIVEDQKRKKE